MIILKNKIMIFRYVLKVFFLLLFSVLMAFISKIKILECCNEGYFVSKPELQKLAKDSDKAPLSPFYLETESYGIMIEEFISQEQGLGRGVIIDVLFPLLDFTLTIPKHSEMLKHENEMMDHLYE